MAIEKVINVKVNSKQAAKSLDDLNKIIEEQKNIQLELQRELLNTEKLLKETPKNAIAAQSQLKKKIDDIKDALKDQNLSLKELNSEKQKAIAKDKEQEKSIGKVSKSFKGLNSALTSLGVIGLIVALVAKLTETFRENQKIVDFVSTTFTAVSIVTNELINKFTDIFAKISEATGGFDALGAVVGGVVKLAFNQLKLTVLALQGGFTSLKLAYEKVFGDDEGVKKAQKDLAEIGVNIKETIKDSGKQVGVIGKNIGEAVGEVVNGVYILAKDGIKAIGEIDAKAAFSQAEAITRNKKNFELLALQQARLQLSFQNQAELQRQVRDDTAKGLAERIEANSKLGAIIDEQFKAEQATIQARIAGLQNEQNLLGATAERHNEIYQLQTDLIDVEERLNGARSEQLTNTTGLLQEQKDLIQSKYDTERELAEAQLTFEAEQAETELEKLEKEKELLILKQEGDLEELERKRLLYLEDTQNRQDAENEYLLAKKEIDNQIISNAKATSEEEKRIAKDAADKEILYKQLVKDSTISLAGQTLDILGSLAKEGGALAKGVAVAQAVMSTYQGINKALAETTDVTPTQTLRFATAAAVGVAGLINVKKILSTKPIETGSGGGGGASAPAAPAAPSFNLVQGTGSNQIAQSLAGERQPIQAFVVSGNVTNQQELDRNSRSEGTV